MLDLKQSAQLLKALAEPTRMRLLALLQREELTVAELAAVTTLAQPRVSTHLARLKELGLVFDRRSGVSAYYRFYPEQIDPTPRAVWSALHEGASDPLLAQDGKKLPEVLEARANGHNWADTVAGDMERHYSPGRTWEATARAAVCLVELGDVLDVASGDGVLAELLAPQARSINCLDISPAVVTACQARLAHFDNTTVNLGDMHHLPFPESRFDLVIVNHALTYTEQPQVVFDEAYRVLRPGGKMLVVTLKKHRHRAAVDPFNHVNLGFNESQLGHYCAHSNLNCIRCAVTSREKRAPNFAVITLLAERPL